MSALARLYEEIEKAGVTRMPTSTRLSLRFAERRGITTSAKRYFKVDQNADYDTSKKPTRQKVRLKGLTATQDNIHSGFRSQKNPSKKPISVYRAPNGKHVIMEGHHRSARAIARGDKSIDAYVHRPRRIKKAGLITPGKRPLLQRVGFLVSASKNDRKAAIGRYLESRKRGLGFGPKGKRRARKGTYTGVYATGVNKSERAMSDAIANLHAEIEAFEKARGGPRSGMIPYGSRHQLGRAKFFEARAKRSGETLSPRAKRARDYLAGRFRGSVKGPKGTTRRAVYKSSEPVMSDAIDNLYEEIEKAKGLIRGGSRGMERRIARQGAKLRDKGGDPKAAKRFSVLGTLANRRKGNSIGLGYEPGRGYKSLRRTGKYT